MEDRMRVRRRKGVNQERMGQGVPSEETQHTKEEETKPAVI